MIYKLKKVDCIQYINYKNLKNYNSIKILFNKLFNFMLILFNIKRTMVYDKIIEIVQTLNK